MYRRPPRSKRTATLFPYTRLFRSNYFHVLRRQMLRDFRKPLIIMTPKSLLRHKLAVSSRDEFLGDSHFMRIKSDITPPADVKIRRMVLSSGKVAYDLLEAPDSAGLDDVSIVRIAQLYPFHEIGRAHY